MIDESDQPSRERAPLLGVFGEALTARMAALIRARPLLVARLIVAPPEAIHAIGAFLHLAPDAARLEADVASIIAERHPRDLLNAALPDCPAGLYRALDRAGDRVRPKAFYERLAVLSRGPFGEALLKSKVLDDSRLSFFAALSGMDPAVAAVFVALRDQYHAEAADCLVAFLRAHGALGEDDLRLPAGAGLPALVRRLTKALGRVSAPDPGFVVPAPYRLVTSTDELQRLGKGYRNCLMLHHWGAAEHHLRLVNGTGVYFVADELRVLAALRRVGGELWVLDQFVGPKNEAPPKGAQAALLRDLAAAGLRVLPTDPQSALARLHGAIQRHRKLLDDGLDDEAEDDEGEAIAA